MESINNYNDIRKLFFENHHTVMLIIDSESGSIVDANSAAASYYGWPCSMLKKMYIFDIDITAEKKLKNRSDITVDLNEKQIYSRHRLKSGMIRDVEIHTSLIKVLEKNYLFSIIHDITNRKRAEEKFEFLSFHDGMTGLFNRPYLEEEIQRLDTCRQLPISVIMGDINNLKLVNDAFGHVNGDLLIKKSADVLKKSCRSEDIIARWGGDEFMILLPETGREMADEIIKRIKQNASCCDLCPIPISIALGSAAKNSQSETIYDVLETAEIHMYRDKLNSRNKVRIDLFNHIIKKLSTNSQPGIQNTEKMKEIALVLAEQIAKNNLKHEYGRTMQNSFKNITPKKLLIKLKNSSRSQLDPETLNYFVNSIIKNKNK
ncbi:MAG: sensor domain-containing diguanylate cyclase [Bacillota bacterium]